ncbi:MAG: 6-phosphofructokinase [Halanaerobiales bacterium]|nr:6-phosphofructokinase [Halanaerobiales bacterium]
MKKIGVLTSGGDAPGMNPAIRAVVRTAAYRNKEVIGFYNGYDGILKNNYIELNRRSVGDIIHRGGTFLRTARCDEFKTKKGRKKAYKNLEQLKVDGLIVIGGNGSLTGAKLLYEEFNLPVMGIPATIDNDLAMTEFCIGFDTAMNTVLDALNKIRDTATSHERTFVVEIMGRDAGYLALHTGMAGGAESILIPEIDFRLEEIISNCKAGIKRGKLHNIIVVAEGAGKKLKDETDDKRSIGAIIGNHIKKELSVETRITILGHLQRGGSPTAIDRIISTRMGAKSVELLLDGDEAKMVSFDGKKILGVNLDEALSKEKNIDMDIYNLARIMSL